MVHRAVEETLDLGGVQVHRHQPVRAGGLEQIGDQPGRDRLPAAVLLVLPGVGVEGRDHGDTLRIGALQRVHHDELFHEPRVHRRGVALQHERVTPADGFLEPDKNLSVGELIRAGGNRFDIEFPGNLRHQFRVRTATEKHQVTPILRLVGHQRFSTLVPLRHGRSFAPRQIPTFDARCRKYRQP